MATEDFSRLKNEYKPMLVGGRKMTTKPLTYETFDQLPPIEFSHEDETKGALEV